MTAKSPYSVRGIAEQMQKEYGTTKGLSKSTIYRRINHQGKKRQRRLNTVPIAPTSEMGQLEIDRRREVLMQFLEGSAGSALLALLDYPGGVDHFRAWLDARVAK
ncbi:hypothetical protein CCR95_06250 [Thiocystis minor]|uniref:hypothetical protein n=1 Tax=Thiocystis minor TaxID=61597 RepID=UPI0019130B29|nr:hypothetical protein [Thiocystis minor]MBK5963695.1 hypothetical protein [Thiocystis minor]